MSDQKVMGAGFTRPPSHPGLNSNKGTGAPGGGLPLPPKPDQQTVKRTSSYVVKPNQQRITNSYGSSGDGPSKAM